MKCKEVATMHRLSTTRHLSLLKQKISRKSFQFLLLKMDKWCAHPILVASEYSVKYWLKSRLVLFLNWQKCVWPSDEISGKVTKWQIKSLYHISYMSGHHQNYNKTQSLYHRQNKRIARLPFLALSVVWLCWLTTNPHCWSAPLPFWIFVCLLDDFDLVGYY